MQTLIQTVEEAIYNKKSQIKYHQEEVNRLHNQIASGNGDIWQLENDLRNLKQLIESKVIDDTALKMRS